MVATVAPAHGADNVVPDNEDSGGPPLPHRGYPMWASKKRKPESVNVNVNYCKMDHTRLEQRWKQRQAVIENIRNLNLSLLMFIVAKWIIGDLNNGGSRGRKK